MARETVGTAFVRILADGKGMRKSIRDALDGTEGEFDESGKKSNDAWQKAFAKRNEKNKTIEKSLTKKIESAFGAIAANRDLLGRDFERNLSRDVEKALIKVRRGTQLGKSSKEIGDRVARNIVDGFSRSGSLPDLSKVLQGEVDKALRQLLAEDEEIRREQERRFREFANKQKRNLKALLKAEAEANKERERQAKKAAKEAERLAKDRFKAEVELERDIQRTIKESLSLSDQSERAVVRAIRNAEDLTVAIDKESAAIEKDVDAHRKRTVELERQNRRLPLFQKRWNLFADSLGRGFGRGSRNDFINLIGSFVRGATRAIGGLLTLIPRVAAGFSKFGSEIIKAGGGLRGIASVSARYAAKGGAALLALLGALLLVIGPLIAALSLLLGVVTSLAASLTFALIASLASLLGLLVPIIAGIGVLTAAIVSLDDAAKKALKKSIKPLVDEFKVLGNIAEEEIFGELERQAEEFTDILGKSLRVLTRRVARAISDVGDIFLEMMRGPGFGAFIDQMEVFLPSAIRRLGQVAANSLGGIGGVFRAMAEPGGLMDRFLNWLVKITDRFNEWANSEKGQKELIKFFEDASDSAESVKNFLGEVVGFLAEIFDQTKGNGDSIFDSMADAFDRATKFFEENPDALEDWAEDAEKFANALGRAINDIIFILGLLDNPATRLIATSIFGPIELATDQLRVGLNNLSATWEKVKEVAVDAWNGIASQAGKVGDRIARMEQAILDFGGGIRESFAAWREFFANIKTRGPKVVQQFLRFINPLEQTDRLLGGIRRIIRAISRLSMLVPGTEKFRDVLDRIDRGLGNIRAMIRRIKNGGFKVPGIDTVRGIADDIRRFLSNIINRVGRIKALSFAIPGLGIVEGTVSAMVQGFDNLIAAIRTAIDLLGDLADKIRSLPNPSIGGGLGALGGSLLDRFSASGGIFSGAQTRIIGEEGAEAVVPLNRSLSQVDPAVRELSAFAQGKLRSLDSGGRSGKTVTVGDLTIVTPTEDPRAVASEVINRLAAEAYI